MKKIYVFFLMVCCVSVVHAQNTDCSNGTILFREDFGGNSPLDPPIMSNQDMQLLYGDKIIGYTPSQNPAGAGFYSIRKEGHHHGDWWIWMDDHTHPYNYTRGYLLQVDGNSNSSGQFYRTKIDNLCVGSTLYFSMWAASVAPGFQRANLSIIIEDLTGTELQRLNTGEIPNAGGCNTQNCVSVSDPFACNDWTHYGITFTITGSTPSVIFKIMNNHSGSSGNDFVIDDIEIRLCTPSVNVIVPVEAVCLGSSAQLTGSFINDGTFNPPLEYQWLYSITGDLYHESWVAIVGENSLTLNIPNVTANHQGYYRLAVAGVGNINLENCRAMSDPMFLEVIACEIQCEGLELYTTGTSPEGCLGLKWQWLQLKSTGAYGFTLYQWNEVIGGWQTASTNYDKTIKVLNVYPNIANSNTLKTWMDDPAIGLGKITVTPVTMTSFNANPDAHLKSGGEYIYDAIVFGSWDGNNSQDLNSTSANAVRNFLNSGRGVLFGHDTQRNTMPNFAELADKINIHLVSDQLYRRGSERIKVINDGFLLKYPHLISYESILTIPLTHSSGQFARGVVWMSFPDPLINPNIFNAPVTEMYGGTNDFYLTTWNNAAMIQTGHSNGAATDHEKKVIANTLWYAAQFTTDTTAKICSALDLAAPDTPTTERHSCHLIEILSKDNGSLYRFYVKATNTTNYADTCISNILDVINESGLRGFYISEDNNPNGVPNPFSSTTLFMAATNNQFVTYTVQDLTKYIHIQAIDSAGNLSEVVTLEPEPNSVVFYANNIYYENLPDTTFSCKEINFRAEIECMHTAEGSLKWFIGVDEYVEARDKLEWNKTFETGNYNIKMQVRFANGEEAMISNILNMNVFWIKMRNVRY